MTNIRQRIADIFTALSRPLAWEQGLAVTSPCDGSTIASIASDTISSLDKNIQRARNAQEAWSAQKRDARASLLEKYSFALKEHRDPLAEIVVLEAGKTFKEAQGEVDGSAEILLKTIRDATLPELQNMTRRKERPPVGVVGLITSFNFPMAVAHWTIGPALLAGNSVLWKPSEKTPLSALACKALFDRVAGAPKDLLHTAIGARDIGAALVSHEGIDLISATGSVAMGQGIRATLAKKKNNAIKPILELGGNNGLIISEKMSGAHLAWSIAALMHSFLGTSGQRCTNTRRLIVHERIFAQTVALLKEKIGAFIAAGIHSPLSGIANEYGYGPLIDADAFARFEKAKKHAVADGGEIIFGARVLPEIPEAFYVEPALAIMPSHTGLMHEEVFAPLLFLVPYKDDIDAAMALLNAPANAGLVSAIYTQSQQEADRFAAASEAGHAVINGPRGTGTPAFGMGFGGNKDSGEGEILNSADPLQAFTRTDTFSRVAQNKDVAMDQ